MSPHPPSWPEPEAIARALMRAQEDPAMLVRLLRRDEGTPARQVRTPAAVLVALLARPVEPTVLLTRRSAHLRDHAGQVSLPGGRMEPEDRSPEDTALREAEEEVGLERRRVRLLGRLPYYDTVTGFRVTPVVGWVATPPARFRPDPFEVAEVFEVPLSRVLDARAYRRESIRRDGQVRHYYVLADHRQHIWGATAGILLGLCRLLTEAAP